MMTNERTTRDNFVTRSSSKQQEAAVHTEQQQRASSTTTATTVLTEPGVFWNPWDLESIRQAYVENIGPLTAAVAGYLEKKLQRGMEPGVILRSIEETGWARRPSPQYLRAILERLEREEVTTTADLYRSRQRHREFVHEENRAKWARWYDDPTYDD